MTGRLCQARIHPEVDDISPEIAALPIRRGTTCKNATQSGQLIVDKRIHGIEDDTANGCRAHFMEARVEPYVSLCVIATTLNCSSRRLPRLCLAENIGEYRQEETLSFAGAGTSSHK